MAGQVVQMDYAVISDVSKGFATARDTLRTVGKVLEVLIGILRVSAMLGNFMAPALIQYLEVIKQKVEKLAKLCDEFASDLGQAINDHKRGDIQGKRYFGEGVRR
ncbi:MAG: hypothetical protein FJ030_10495 [Chloroflexi bacterium]|nr:hypothetical protein [Chloroflexota bacterium]